MHPFDPTASDSIIRLHDGRALGYTEVGTCDGPPIFHFHGYGSSRLEVSLLAEAATRLGVRLVGLDRPGIGRSDPKPGHRLLDWPDEVVEVADQLHLERFAALGVSNGGAYAWLVRTKSRIGSPPVASFARSDLPTSSLLRCHCGCVWLSLQVSIFPGSIVSTRAPSRLAWDQTKPASRST